MRRLRQASAFAAVAAVVGAALLVQAACGGGDERVVVPATGESIAMGAALFETNCQVCHGTDGRGSQSAPDLTIHIPTRSDDFIYRRITEGFESSSGLVMPSFESSLTGEERAHLVNFLRDSFGELTINTPVEG